MISMLKLSTSFAQAGIIFFVSLICIFIYLSDHILAKIIRGFCNISCIIMGICMFAMESFTYKDILGLVVCLFIINLPICVKHAIQRKIRQKRNDTALIGAPPSMSDNPFLDCRTPQEAQVRYQHFSEIYTNSNNLEALEKLRLEYSIKLNEFSQKNKL